MGNIRIALLIGSIMLACTGATEAAANPTTTAPSTAPTSAPTWPANKPAAPTTLPGSGLSQHDFFYAGEASSRDMYIIRHGAIAWEYHDAKGHGEISDAMLLSNGNVLFAHQFGVTLIDSNQKVLWNFDAPPKSEIHTAQIIGANHVLFIINGPQPRVMVVNIVSGSTAKELPLPVRNLNSTHGQFRHARLTAAGTLLVAHMDLGKVAEYDDTGKEVWSIPAPGCWSAERLVNGNTLITCSREVREVNSAGELLWHFTPADIPDYHVLQFQIAIRLGNGNTLVNNWANQWNMKIDPATAPAQAWEISPQKQIVWALRSWLPPPPWARQRQFKFWMTSASRKMCISGRYGDRRNFQTLSQRRLRHEQRHEHRGVYRLHGFDNRRRRHADDDGFQRRQCSAAEPPGELHRAR